MVQAASKRKPICRYELVPSHVNNDITSNSKNAVVLLAENTAEIDEMRSEQEVLNEKSYDSAINWGNQGMSSSLVQRKNNLRKHTEGYQQVFNSRDVNAAIQKAQALNKMTEVQNMKFHT
ncbi:hypothetical protein JTB14_027499 [Gonioctena quinquepunctata]|nr:hypothetical protein JTB14_027499 [Gonioctena quinquepunctata]